MTSLEFIEKVMTIGGNGTEVPTLQFYRKGFNLGGGKVSPTWQDITIHGETALTLVNAKAESLEYLKLFGNTELLPETYLDTVTLSGGCEQRNLPIGYQELSYLQGDGTAYIQTPVVPTNTTGMKIVFEYGSAGGSGAICGTFNGVSPRKDTFFVSTNSGTVDTTWSFIAQAGSTILSTSSEAPVAGKTYTALINYKNSGTYGFEGFTQQSVGTNGVLSNKVLLFARLNIANNNITASNCKIKYVEFTEGSAITHIYIPSRFNNTLGLYDKITGAFLTNTNTSGSFTAGPDVTTPTPSQPIDIVCNNGTIKVSKNVFDYKYYYDHYQIYQTSSVGRCPIKLKPNTTYTISTNTEFNTISAQIFVVSGSAISWTPNTSNNGVLTNSPRTLATDSSGYLCVGIYYKGDSTIPESDFDNGTVWVQIEEGSTATSYTPYSPDGIYTDGTVETITDSLGNTASAERLLAVGTYKDTQSVINGSVTKRVGILVLDGTETWSYDSQFARFTSKIQPNSIEQSSARSIPAYCTHFKMLSNGEAISTITPGQGYLGRGAGSDVTFVYFHSSLTTTAQFQQFLADQYANGTPVIVVYPLATATTSTVQGQFLSKSPVEQTSGSISNLPIAITESAHTTPTPLQPLDINCNNGVVKYGVQGSDLFDKTTITTGYYYNDNLEYKTAAQSTYISDYIPVLSGKQYALFSVNGQTAGNIRINYFNSSKQIQSQYVYAIPNSGTWEVTIIIPNGIDYIRFSAGTAFTNSLTFYQYGIYVDGTTETVEITGKNLLDTRSSNLTYYGASLGTLVYYPDGARHSYILDMAKVGLSSGDTVTVSCTSRGTSSYWTVGAYAQIANNEPSLYYDNQGSGLVKTFTIPNGAHYIVVFSGSGYAENQMIETGNQATTYEQYYNGGTATAQPLYKVGTYQDVQEVITGGVTRNVGIKVLDGSEDWTYDSQYSRFSTNITPLSIAGTSTRSIPAYCTHFEMLSNGEPISGITAGQGYIVTIKASVTSTVLLLHSDITTIASFKQYLSDQYNAGQPVIVVYPLATPTTQTVTAQPMNIQAGTNVVQITQASMDDLELEVKYKAGVAVTIEEIENAQLDNNVEVTING